MKNFIIIFLATLLSLVASADNSSMGFVELDVTPLVVVTEKATDITQTTAILHATVTAGDEDIVERGFMCTTASNEFRVVDNSGEKEGKMSVELKSGLSANSKCTFYAYAKTESGTVYGEELTFYTQSNAVCIDGIYYDNFSSSSSDGTCVVSYMYYSEDNTLAYRGGIIIPPSIEYNGATYSIVGIDDYALAYCSEITSVQIPETVTYIGTRAFYYCEGMNSINLPNNAKFTSINNRTFYGCASLTSLEIPESVVRLGTNSFAECTNLKTITMGDNLNEIDGYTFYHSGLESVEIPDKVTSDLGCCFWGCSDLKTVTLGVSIDKLGTSAFADCTSLKTVYSHNPNPPIVDSDLTFSHVDLERATLYVPEGSRDAYREAEKWKDFYMIIEMAFTSSDGIDEIVHLENVEEVYRYTTDGRQVSAPEKGMNIVRYSDGTTKKILVK